MSEHPLSDDLNHILRETHNIWDDLRGERLFITGGTGFCGCWLLESLTYANDQLNLGITATVLTRNPEGFRRKVPHLANHPSLEFHVGDLRNSDIVMNRSFWVGVYPGLNEEMLDFIVRTMRQACRKANGASI